MRTKAGGEIRSHVTRCHTGSVSARLVSSLPPPPTPLPLLRDVGHAFSAGLGVIYEGGTRAVRGPAR